MNTLTALRTFGKSSLTPAKGTRILDSKYYLVTMQNTERDMGGIYLADGEYRELLTGHAARQRRDARLNHCNHITEWTGPVFAVLTSRYGFLDTSRKPNYVGSQVEADAFVADARNEHSQWLVKCSEALAMYQAKYAAKPEEWLAGAIRNCERVIRENQNTFCFEILQVR